MREAVQAKHLFQKSLQAKFFGAKPQKYVEINFFVVMLSKAPPSLLWSHL